MTSGVVYLPGAAGTVQEVFQATTPVYYSENGGVPLVLLGGEHCQERLRAWPLLSPLADSRPMAERVHLVDDPHDHDAVLKALLPPGSRGATPPRP